MTVRAVRPDLSSNCHEQGANSMPGCIATLPGTPVSLVARTAHRMIDRELSLLAFNRRVLAQATRPDVALLERLRYVTIVSSNLDEFFEVRFPDYLEIVRTTGDEAAHRTFATVSREAHELIDEQYRVLNEQVMPALAGRGIRILNHAERSAPQKRWVARFFESQVRPLLVPVALDPAHPFPLVANKSLNFILKLTGEDVHAAGGAVVIVKVPRSLPQGDQAARPPDARGRAGIRAADQRDPRSSGGVAARPDGGGVLAVPCHARF